LAREALAKSRGFGTAREGLCFAMAVETKYGHTLWTTMPSLAYSSDSACARQEYVCGYVEYVCGSLYSGCALYIARKPQWPSYRHASHIAGVHDTMLAHLYHPPTHPPCACVHDLRERVDERLRGAVRLEHRRGDNPACGGARLRCTAAITRDPCMQHVVCSTAAQGALGVLRVLECVGSRRGFGAAHRSTTS
jgi:hypothetical protein